jgi:hypothetical protein
MSRLLPIALALASTIALGCEGFIGGGDDSAGPGGLDTTPSGNALPVDHPTLDAPITSAGARRISVEQLRRSLPVVLGNDAQGAPITWKVGSKNGLDDNADTLGEADYVNTTEDNLEPAPLYLKFIDDAARDVCTRALAADATRTDPALRVILRHVDKTDTVQSAATQVDQNLRYLKLRFHGVKIADTDTTSLAPLRTLFDQAVTKAAAGEMPTASQVSSGWHLVCVALLTAPEFHIY